MQEIKYYADRSSASCCGSYVKAAMKYEIISDLQKKQYKINRFYQLKG